MMSHYLKSTIGRKQVMGVTGLGLSIFVLSHMLGNLLIFVGPESYNTYAHNLVTNPLIYIAEAGLLGIFVAHVFMAITLNFKNKSARGSTYAFTPNGDKAASFASKTMIHQGIVILVFVILHLNTFKLGTIYDVNYGGVDMRDLHRLVIEVFQAPMYTVFYIVCLIILGFHLSHGLASAIQTLGFNHPKYTPCIEKISVLYGLVIAIGFISQPVYVYFFN